MHAHIAFVPTYHNQHANQDMWGHSSGQSIEFIGDRLENF
jgi:hypothetical protein